MVSTRLRRATAGLVALAVLTVGLLGSAQGQDKEKGKGDQEQFQGTWEVVSVEKGGEKLPEEVVKDIKLTFQGDKLTLQLPGDMKQGTFKIDPSQKPKTINMTVDDKTAEGIYAFEGKTLKNSASEPGEARPKEFKSEGANNLVVLRRVGGKEPAGKDKKEGAGAGKKSDDRALLQGTWVVSSGEKDGEKLPEELLRTIKLTLKGDKASVDLMGETKEATVTLDQTKKPKTIDVEFDGQTVRGIYTLEKGVLRVCATEPGMERPTEFKSAGGQLLLVFKREAGAKEKEGEKEPKKGDKEAGKSGLDGTWTVMSAVKGGEKLPDELIKLVKLTFKGEEFTLVIPGDTKKGKFKIDPTKKPATIDMTVDNETGLGIYELNGDMLKMCAAEPGKGRPKEFKADGEELLVILKRGKPEEKKDPGKPKEAPDSKKEELQGVSLQQPEKKSDQDRIQGTWAVQSVKENGREVPDEKAKSATLTFRDKRLAVQFKDGDKEGSKDGTFKLDPKQKPSHIDIDFAGDKRAQGIYKLEGDTLTLAIKTTEGRPTEFASDEGSRVVLIVLKRAKPKAEGKPDGAKQQDEAGRLREELKRARLELEETRRQLEAAVAREREAREQEQKARQQAEAALRQAQAEAARVRAVALAQEQQAQQAAARAVQGADRQASHNNLKQIGLAMHGYHDTNKRFPTAAIYSKDGKPLLSWRVAILPFIDQQNLYREFKLDEPWDSEHNKKLLEKMPKVYAPVGGVEPKEAHSTFYRVFTGPGTVFEGMKGLGFTSITDGTSNTVLVAEAGEAVPWTKPDELPYEAGKDLPKLGGLFRTGFHLLMADGVVMWVGRTFDVPTLRNVITRNDGQVIDLDKLKSKD